MLFNEHVCILPAINIFDGKLYVQVEKRCTTTSCIECIEIENDYCNETFAYMWL